jgi:N-methylhydantoinase A/oxoprolinase/acetone carboxylase beta subunit
MYRIGVDVGGTNTDAVVMAGRDILAAVKVATSSDVTTGLMQALREVQKQAAIAPGDVALVVIGTTHFTNAVIERRHLSETAVVRLCLPAAQCLLPMVDWPADLRSAIGDHIFLASGGVEFDGTPIAAFDPKEISRIGAVIRERGIKAIAVAGVFAPVKDDFEREAAGLLAAAWDCSNGRAPPFSTAHCCSWPAARSLRCGMASPSAGSPARCFSARTTAP